AVGLGLTIAIAALTYALGRMVAGTLGGFLAAAIVVSVALAPTNFSYVLPHTEAATLGLALLLGMLVALNRSSLATAGVCAGLAGLPRPELDGAGLVAYAAIVAVLVLLARGLDLSLRPAALVAAGATLGIVAAVARPGSLVQGLQLAYGWIPAGAAIAVVLLLALRRSSDSLLPAAL